MRIFPGGLSGVLFCAAMAGCATAERTASIPEKFAKALPGPCEQVVLVVANRETSSEGRLWMLAREDSSSPWSSVAGPVPVDLGRNGMAWGNGERMPAPPAGFRLKREGDGCSPAGIFRIPFAFGYAPSAPGLRLKYVAVSATLAGVDDSASRYYNQLADSARVTPDWKHCETMLRKDGIYRWGAFVAYNPDNVPGGGSCIFMHIWHGPGYGTSGCTAMSEENLLRVLKWLDPAREPRLVQVVRGWDRAAMAPL